MLKILFISTILFLFSSKPCIAQDTLSVTFEDGKKMTFDLKEDGAQNIQKVNFWIGIAGGLNRMSFGGISYYIHRKHLFNTHFGMGGGFEGTAFFFTSEKFQNSKRTVGAYTDYDQVSNTSTTYKYSTEFPTKTTTSLGVHYGLGHYLQTYTHRHFASYGSLGLSYLKVLHNKWYIHGQKNGLGKPKKFRGSSFLTINLDGLYYYHHEYELHEDYNLIPDGSVPNSPGDITESEFQKENELNSNIFGFRLYVEGNLVLWNPVGVLGIKYMFGGGIPAMKTDLFYMLGIGVSFSLF